MSKKRPKHLANAEFTRDMAETLISHFADYEVEGIVTIEVTDKGLWLKNPEGGQQFLGATKSIHGDLPSLLQ